MIRIAVVTLSSIPSNFANSIQVVRMCTAMGSLGHDVVVYAPPPEPGASSVSTYEFYGVPPVFDLVRVPLPAFRGGAQAFALNAVRRARVAADVVYTRSIEAAFFAAALRIPTILELHAPMSSFRPTRRGQLRAVMRLGHLRKIVVISQFLRERILSAGAGCEVLVAHDGADVRPNAEAKAVDSGPLKRCVVGYAGSLHRGRGIDMLLQLAEQCPWAEINIYGGTPKQVQSLADVVTARPNVWVHGAVPPSEVQDKLAHCDVLVAPYEQAVFTAAGHTDTSQWMSPLKIFEYMAAQRPIVASNVTAIREIITHGKNALLCDPGDVQAWAEALCKLRSDGHLRRELAANAYALVQDKYSWRARAREILGGVVT